MKHLALTLLMTLASSLTFASGGGGGGGWRPGTMMMTNPGLSEFGGTGGGGVMRPTEIVYHMGEQRNSIRFAYGQLQNNQWQIQKIELPKAAVVSDPAFLKALADSKNMDSWVKINN